MIIDMDTHILPRDIYDYVDGKYADQKPQFEFDKDGILVKWSFPGNHVVKGTTPLPPPGAGGTDTLFSLPCATGLNTSAPCNVPGGSGMSSI